MEDNKPLNSLDESDVQVTPNRGRRAFLKVAGLGVTGIAVIAGAALASKARDFPKGSSDSDRTENKDLKATDSDSHNSMAVDSNQNRLRDVKRSADSD